MADTFVTYSYDDMLKDDLVSALDDKLRADAPKFAGNPIFSEFYKRGGSPVKRPRTVSSSIPGADGDPKTARRRKTITAKVKDELENGLVAYVNKAVRFAPARIVEPC